MARRSIIFFGAGPVALASLEHIHTIYDIELVVTKPNPRSSRAKTPVYDYAKTKSLSMIQPNGKTELESMLKERELQSSVGIVVDYGVIITQSVIDMFEHGIINSHFSRLPLWRGADPITFSLLSGNPQTGVSLMVINAELDEGQLIAQEDYTVASDETIHSLTSNLVDLSNTMISQYFDDYLDGKITPVDQSNDIEPTYSRKLKKSDGVIDWNKPATQIELEIRAYLGWPSSKATLSNVPVTITSAYATPSSAPNTQPGDVTAHKKLGVIEVATASGSLWIQKLKPAGKQEMDAGAFINGYLNKS